MMSLYEVYFKWAITGVDSAIVRADNKKQANEIFESNFGSQFDPDEVIADGVFIELMPEQTELTSAIQHFLPGFEDDFEIIS